MKKKLEKMKENYGENSIESSEKKRKREYEIRDIHTYTGETSRSAWERGEEHWKDLKYRRPKSHMMRHMVEYHPEKTPDEADFRMQIISSHNSAFERQIREAVLIERHDGPFSMNSELEYSRTVIPKMKVKLGEKAEEESPRVKREKEMVEKIKEIQSEYNKKKRLKKNEENIGNSKTNVKGRKIFETEVDLVKNDENYENDDHARNEKNEPENLASNTIMIKYWIAQISQISNKK